MSYVPDARRYESMPYRPAGRSGLRLPAVSLGLWHNFGDDRPFDVQRSILRLAFDLGVTHFDLANNYGPDSGAAERNFGRHLREDLMPHRDEMVISTKAGWEMWGGPYGEGSSRKHLVSSLDASLHRLGLDYVDIFYSHRFDSETPLAETMGALDAVVRQGKALYVGISSYSAAHTEAAIEILRSLGTPMHVHQANYSLLNRWIERDLLDVLGRHGVGCIAFSPLAQGLLTGRYVDGEIPEDSRAARRTSLDPQMLGEANLTRIRALDRLARGRGQSLAQMAIAWTLRDPRITSALIGASSTSQIEDSLAAVSNLHFTDDELTRIEPHAVDGNIDLWSTSSAPEPPNAGPRE